MKHIIVEGPDGAGKTTLIAHLAHTLHMPIHEKASHSVEGPVNNLMGWVEKDRAVLNDPDRFSGYIYDRHPVISEPIYGYIVRGNLQVPFGDANFQELMRTVMYDTCVVVWCLPSLDVVARNVFSNTQNQMAGVTLKIGRVHQAYNTAYFRWRGVKTQYDYTRHGQAEFTDKLRKMVHA